MKGFFIGWLTGAFSIGIAFAIGNAFPKEPADLTYQELKEMKDSCEKHLTRVEHCVIVVSYKQENKQDIEQE